ncbi:MAG: redoxin domain-containing protein [Deltaproteobacteria bacterium]|nr:redoxin domain-containing protein [Deltaproteobacteria bacterium]
MQLQSLYPKLRSQRVALVPISTDRVEESQKLKEKLGLSFALYSDPRRFTIERWDVADPDSKLALQATFVIAEGGRVAFRHYGPSDDALPGKILGTLERLP